MTTSSQALDTDTNSPSAPSYQSVPIKDPISFALPPEIQQMFGSFLGPNHPSTTTLMQGSENYPQPQNMLGGYFDYNPLKDQEVLQKPTMYDTVNILDIKAGGVTTPGNMSNWGKNNKSLQWDFGFSLPEFDQNSMFDTAYLDVSNGAAALNYNDPMFDMINFNALDSQV
jgi:hypothetical protein